MKSNGVNADKYVPAIGDRVRIVDADCLGGEVVVGTVTRLDSGKCFEGRSHPIEVTADDDHSGWYAVEVELIETAAEFAEYEEGLAEAQRTYGVPQRFMVGADPDEMTADDAQDLIVARPDDGDGWLDDRGWHPGTRVSTEEVRVTSATGGQKGQKPAQLSTVDALALLKLAEVGGYGGRKYEPHNYLRGYAWSLSLDALFRHILAFESGEDFDPESGLPHVTHAAWHCLALTSFMVRGLGTDDRFRQDGVCNCDNDRST